MTTTGDRRPGIFQIGRVDVVDDEVLVRGWGLCLCFDQCRCHFHPANGHLYVLEDQERGLLGLRSFAMDGCSCCTPWTAEELESIVQDLESIAA